MFTQHSHYGWRARIGLIVPSVNLAMEPEFNLMAPEGIAFYASRVLVVGKTTPESYRAMSEEAARAARELATADLDAVVYGCTSGSIVGGNEETTRRIQDEVGNAYVVTPATAVVEAIRTLGLRKMAVATPYVGFVNDQERLFLEESGLEVTRIIGLDLGHDEQERKMIQHQSPGVIYRLAREADTPDSDGVFISCTALPAIHVIERLEADLHKPVVTSNQATMWALLRRLNLPDRPPRLGRLMRDL